MTSTNQPCKHLTCSTAAAFAEGLVIFGLTLGMTLSALSAAAADMPFSSDNTIVSSFDGATSVITVDIDLDGDLDVAASSRWDGTVSWFENPSWTPHTVATGFTEAYQVCTGDFNGDGRPDLAGAALGAAGSNVRWWANPGPGGGAWTEVNVSGAYLSQALAIAAADLNADGRIDILAAGYHSSVGGTFMWFYNQNSTGTLFHPYDIGTGYSTPHSISVAYIDNVDRRLDVIGTTYSGDEVLWFQSTEPLLTLDPWPVETVATGVDGAICVRGADLDSDGDTDLVVAAYDGGDIKWYENSGDGIPTWSSHTVETSFAGVYSVQPLDMDLDGDLDILAAARTDDEVRWWEHVGSFWYERSIDTSFNGARAAVGADLDHDGDYDVVAAADAADAVTWWENLNIHRDARYASPSTVVSDTASYTAVGSFDANQDGKIDVVAVATNDDASADISLFLQGSTPSAWSEQVIEDSLSGAASLRIADLNRDSLPDLLVAAPGAGDIVMYKNTSGSGYFGTYPVTASFAGAADAEAVDVDGDGILDVVGVAESAGLVRWWHYTPGASVYDMFTEHALATLAGAAAVAAGDLDGDLDQDVVVSATSGTVIWYENLGDSPGGWLWTPRTLATDLHAPRTVAVGDVSGDGRPDIVVGSSTTSSDLSLWRNLGTSPATFTRSTLNGPLGTTDGVTQLRLVDLDLDGDLDVAGVLTADQQAVEWVNLGGSWISFEIAGLSGEVEPRALTAADIDDDGDPDPVVAGNDGVVLIRNRGGQYSMSSFVGADGSYSEGNHLVLFTIIPHHLGRVEDLALELEWLNLYFKDAGGDPLSESQINALVDRLYVFHDTNGNMMFDWGGPDNLLVIENPIEAGGSGYVQLAVPHGPVNPPILANTSDRYFLVAELASGASTATPSCFQVTNSAGGTVTPLRYDLYDIEPRPAYFSSVVGGLVCAGEGTLLFADGFESGDTSRWSATVP